MNYSRRNQTNQLYNALLKLGVNVYPGYYNFVHFYPPLSTLQYVDSPNRYLTIFEEELRPIGLYIHIPFCSSACKFCYYSKRVGVDRKEVDKYLQYIEKEIKLISKYLKAKIYSIYVGGGSPSYLTEEQISYLIEIIKDNFDISEIREFNFEVEPETFNEDKLSLLLDAGVDRISMGIQSLDDTLLQSYRRTHKSKDAKIKSWLLHDSGIRTYNIDFIYGLSGQSIEDIIKSMEFIQVLLPPSVTFYQLWFVSQVRINCQRWASKVSSLETIVVMKNIIEVTMENIGYSCDNQCWYILGIDDRCKHFGFTWRNNPYIGIGMSAYSYVNGVAYKNAKSLTDYYRLMDINELPISNAKYLTSIEKAIRTTILGLKTNSGVSLVKIENNYDVRLTEPAQRLLSDLCYLGILSKCNETILFTERGRLWGDCVLSKLMDVGLFS